jgi:hypothetical protein
MPKGKSYFRRLRECKVPIGHAAEIGQTLKGYKEKWNRGEIDKEQLMDKLMEIEKEIFGKHKIPIYIKHNVSKEENILSFKITKKKRPPWADPDYSFFALPEE